MIRIKPFEWLHMTVEGRGSAGKTKLNGTLYITPHRIVIQTGNGPEWSADIRDITVQSKDTIQVQDGRQLKWSSKNTWWTEAIKFWKEGVVTNIQHTDDPLPTYSTIQELPNIIRNTRYNIRWYDKTTLNIQRETDEFKKVARDTNIILAALRYDGYTNGPPPIHHVRMLQRHALVYATNLAYSWKSAQRRILNIIQGKGHLAGEGMLDRHDWNGPDHWLADHPDIYHMSKPIAQYVSADNPIRAPPPPPPKWNQTLSPTILGGHPYGMLHKCRTMIPIVMKLADEMHENPTHTPYMRIKQIYLALLQNAAIPPPPVAALPAARNATGNLW